MHKQKISACTLEKAAAQFDWNGFTNNVSRLKQIKHPLNTIQYSLPHFISLFYLSIAGRYSISLSADGIHS